MTKQHKKMTLLGMGVLISLSCTSSVIAADVAGHSSGTQKVLESISLNNGQTAIRMLYHVGLVTDAQEGLFHGATQKCIATVVQAGDGSTVKGRGSCDGIDPDGDVFWVSIALEADGPFLWAITGGTGKYAGLEMSGVNNVVAEHSDGIMVGRWEGNHAAD
jgi:hypothetical protein